MRVYENHTHTRRPIITVWTITWKNEMFPFCTAASVSFGTFEQTRRTRPLSFAPSNRVSLVV